MPECEIAQHVAAIRMGFKQCAAALDGGCRSSLGEQAAHVREAGPQVRGTCGVSLPRQVRRPAHLPKVCLSPNVYCLGASRVFVNPGWPLSEKYSFSSNALRTRAKISRPASAPDDIE